MVLLIQPSPNTVRTGTAGEAFTVSDPVAVTVPQPPVSVMVKLALPVDVGVPLIVILFEFQDPVTPVGNPEKLAPVAPVVE